MYQVAKVSVEEDGWKNCGGNLSWKLVEKTDLDYLPITRIAVRREDGSVYIPSRALARERDLPSYAVTNWFDDIKDAARNTGVFVQTIIACMCTESACDPCAQRFEAIRGDYSLGLMQTLTTTAWSMGDRLGYPIEVDQTNPKALRYKLPRHWLDLNRKTHNPQETLFKEWKAFLFDPRNSILIGAKALQEFDKTWNLKGDPVTMAASYNAGGPYVDKKNPWGLRMFGPHVDAFVGFWNLASELL
jgi:soluble lytic murein transglycosylase-like protein